MPWLVFLLLSILAADVRADAMVAARAAVLNARLRDVPLSASARAAMPATTRWLGPRVRDVVRADRAGRRAWLGHDPKARAEMRQWLAAQGLRFDLTLWEIEKFEREGRPTALSLQSLVCGARLSIDAETFALDAGASTLGEVRAKRLDELVYNSREHAGLAKIRAEFRNLHLGPDAVITKDEAEFADALRESRIGRRALHALRDLGVHTFADLARVPFARIAAGGVLEQKMVRQMKSLLPRACQPKFMDDGET